MFLTFNFSITLFWWRSYSFDSVAQCFWA